jgi:peptide-methionine (S)-S-oxide reductase
MPLVLFTKQKTTMISADDALPGRGSRPFAITNRHFVLGTPLEPPYPGTVEEAYFGMGCFWGAERLFWEVEGVVSTAVGYQGGHTPNPTYEEVCSARTGHAEIVKVVYDPAKISYADLLKVFWESHDPTQGMRQGNDVGTQYRSAIFTTTETQAAEAAKSRELIQPSFAAAGYGEITAEIGPAAEFYYAEDYHQQYLAKNPNGYCGISGTGVTCPVPRASH